MQAVGAGRGHGSASALARGVSHTRKHVALGPRVRYVATSAASFGAASHLSVHDFAYQAWVTKLHRFSSRAKRAVVDLQNPVQSIVPPEWLSRIHQFSSQAKAAAATQASSDLTPYSDPSQIPQQVPVIFKVPYQCAYGQNLYITGSDVNLGSWNIDKAVPMHWSDGDVWVAETSLTRPSVEYKYVVKNADGTIARWQEDDNMKLDLSHEAAWQQLKERQHPQEQQDQQQQEVTVTETWCKTTRTIQWRLLPAAQAAAATAAAAMPSVGRKGSIKKVKKASKAAAASAASTSAATSPAAAPTISAVTSEDFVTSTLAKQQQEAAEASPLAALERLMGSSATHLNSEMDTGLSRAELEMQLRNELAELAEQQLTDTSAASPSPASSAGAEHVSAASSAVSDAISDLLSSDDDDYSPAFGASFTAGLPKVPLPDFSRTLFNVRRTAEQLRNKGKEAINFDRPPPLSERQAELLRQLEEHALEAQRVLHQQQHQAFDTSTHLAGEDSAQFEEVQALDESEMDPSSLKPAGMRQLSMASVRAALTRSLSLHGHLRQQPDHPDLMKADRKLAAATNKLRQANGGASS